MVRKVTISAKYLDFTNVFSKNSAAKLFVRSEINKHIINLKSGKQPSYKPIYSLKLVKFKTLKTYIEINLANNFIQSSKSLVQALILFVQNPNSSLRFCMDY